MVSSTTPRLGPMWPPVRAHVVMRKSRISVASPSSCASSRSRRSRGDVIESRVPIAGESTSLEGDDRDRGLVEAAQPDPAVVLPDAGDHVVAVARQVEVVDERSGVVVRLDPDGAL